jgi:hypothetical protein
MSSNYVTVRDILTAVDRMHRELAAACRRLAATAETRLQLVAGYVADHENRLRGTLQRTLADGRPEVLDTWFQLPTSLDQLAADAMPEDFDTIGDADLLVARVEAIEEARRQFFTQLADTAPTPEVQALLSGLAQQEAIEQRRLQMAALRLQDM